MKKTDVYVVVDTPKKAKKLKKVLDMFGERTYSKSSIQDCLDNTENVLGFDEEENAFLSGYVHQFEESRIEVSIKELRNILAMEYLKEGDVSLFEDKGYKVLGRYKKYSDAFKDFVCDKIEGNSSTTTGFHNFIRYAAEEEKALLEPKKELEVGKWYKTEKSLFNHQDGYDSYGFFNKKWKSGDWKTYLDDFAFVTPVEATEYEVKSALVEEAKKRGYKDGDIIRSLFSGMPNTIRGNEYDYSPSENILAINGNWVFRNGKWAEIIEKGAFDRSYIAIVERLHDTLLDNHGYSLDSKLLTDARMLASKIKSNIK